MPFETIHIDTLVIGAGQAGVAMSEHLSRQGVPHLVVERNRIAEAWRTARWDSLVANGPAWHDRFPGLEFEGLDPDAFAGKDQVADYFVAYASKFNAPIRTGVDVRKVQRNVGRPGFSVETSEGLIEAIHVVVATGPFQRAVIPPIAPDLAGIVQMHSAQYRNPGQLSEGAVLVVGAGSSGVQIADELLRAGKRVYLSVGAHDRPPRSYRNRDFCWWLGVLGEWDAEAVRPGKEHVTIAVSGARGGHTVDFRRLAHEGITLVGLTKAFDGGQVRFEPNLAENIARGDENYLALLDAADAYIARNGLDLPLEPEARQLPPDPPCLTHPILALDLLEAGVGTIIWATGYSVDYSWLKVDVLDANGKPRHQRGVSSEPGLYFVGLPWLSRRGSAFIWGVWHDARHISDHIVKQRTYLAYRRPSDSLDSPAPAIDPHNSKTSLMGVR
ncbi:NAD(P)/FAD-dependent oxidoreductase [Pseudomonas sp. CCNWLW56]|uniref:flavin-containing monooxygenase n=1 Tax=Pseudomonas TaxID=286 RepID=UPI00091668D7|nr:MULTISPECIES: NAD(P)/FAD-dependent oxidoreductase [Pseudomonas]MDT8905743.1 NAD(P)/FAD-dependent oxidoreductase [Pseudomonas prosekii]NHN68064.1 NAD(P)-binding domain-containing protein [Pseudomonas fluorescens]ROO34830.1 FAD-dependent oxidoreductase [Pseudomonas sp. 7SR1]ROO42339.1 FAD-dependent oxidoreductase [Pseudomonas sp. AF76]SFY15534.1 putative flavoprotein involved in K+ transport [Pseudomonas sp. NFACC49-2]